MTSPISINRERLVQVFFFVAFGFLLYQMFLLSRPFFPGLFGAWMLALTFYPAYSWVKNRVKRPSVAAFIMTAAVLIVVVLPILSTFVFVIQEAKNLIPTIQGYIEAVKNGDMQFIVNDLPPVLQSPVEKIIVKLNDIGIDLEPVFLNQIRTIGSAILSWGTLTFMRLVMWFLNSLVLVIALFFAFRDGDKLFQWALSLIPMQKEYKKAIARRAYETFRAVAIGVGVTALFQGFMAMIGFWIAGVHLPVFFGMATVVASLLGAAFIVTIPVALVIMRQDFFWGMFLVVWGLLVVGLLDNFLRPYLIGSRARMPFFLILFGIVGGVTAYGFVGVILGPVLVASILTFITIYREEYGQHQ